MLNDTPVVYTTYNRTVHFNHGNTNDVLDYSRAFLVAPLALRKASIEYL